MYRNFECFVGRQSILESLQERLRILSIRQMITNFAPYAITVVLWNDKRGSVLSFVRSRWNSMVRCNSCSSLWLWSDQNSVLFYWSHFTENIQIVNTAASMRRIWRSLARIDEKTGMMIRRWRCPFLIRTYLRMFLVANVSCKCIHSCDES